MADEGGEGGDGIRAARRSGVALVVVAFVVGGLALALARPLTEVDVAAWVGVSMETADVEVMTTAEYGRFLVLGPVIVPRGGVLVLAGALAVCGVILVAVAGRRRNVSTGPIDPWAIGGCVVAAGAVAVAATPPDFLTTIMALAAAAIVSCTAYALVAAALWAVARRPA